MFGLFQSTPHYVGDGQPSTGCTGGGLGWLTGIFAFTGTPNYLGPSPKPTEPTPTPVPTPTPTPTDPGCDDTETEADLAKTSAIPIAILIQRAD